MNAPAFFFTKRVLRRFPLIRSRLAKSTTEEMNVLKQRYSVTSIRICSVMLYSRLVVGQIDAVRMDFRRQTAISVEMIFSDHDVSTIKLT
jgi:hypothetical protein